MTVDIRPARYAGWRALAATVLVMSGATAAHTWAGGHLPAWPGLLLLGAAVLGTSTLLFRGRTTPQLLLPAVLAAQACLHTSFVAASGHGAHTLGPAPSPWSGRMLLAHAFVAVLTLLVWRLCARGAVVVLRLLAFPPTSVVGRRDRVTASPAPRSRTSLVLLIAAPRRGPPAVACHV